MSDTLLQQILSELKEMKTDIHEVKTDVQGMKTDIEVLKVDVQVMKSDMQHMKSQINENTQMIRAIYDRQEETDAKQEALTMDVHKLHGEVASVKEEQTLHSKILLQLADGQTRQERILERLSLRSIEQETNLFDLRRIV